MIANLGYSGVHCKNTPVSIGKLDLHCDYGTIGKILDFGVNNPKSGSPPDACVINAANSACKPTSSSIKDLLKESLGNKSFQVAFAVGDFYNSYAGETCMNETNDFFVQYSCEQSEQVLATKFNYISLAVSTVTLISLLFVLVLKYLYKGGKIQQLEWDLSTVTAGDYSVEFVIPAQAYQIWY